MLARCAGHHRASHGCPQSEEEPALPRAIETQLRVLYVSRLRCIMGELVAASAFGEHTGTTAR